MLSNILTLKQFRRFIFNKMDESLNDIHCQLKQKNLKPEMRENLHVLTILSLALLLGDCGFPPEKLQSVYIVNAGKIRFFKNFNLFPGWEQAPELLERELTAIWNELVAGKRLDSETKQSLHKLISRCQNILIEDDKRKEARQAYRKLQRGEK